MFPRTTVNQEIINGYNAHTAYLTSLMQNLSLSSNNYQGESSLPNQYQTSYDQPVIGNNIMGLNYNRQYAAASSSSSSGSNSSELNNRNSIIQAPALYSSTANRLRNDFIESRRYDHDRPTILLRDFLRNPFVVMTDSRRCSAFLILLQDCPKSVITGILNKIAEYPDEYLVLASCHKVAFQVLKKLIHVARKLPGVGLFPRTLAPSVVSLMSDPYGRHVVQECFVSLDKFKNETLYEEVVKHWREIATTKYGCISIQVCIDYMDSSPTPSYTHQGETERIVYAPSLKERLLMIISNNAASLALDVHGNYVLQHVIMMNYPLCNEIITTELRPIYEILCTNKSGSYLVEKCCGCPFRSYVAEELLKSKKLVMIVQNEFGNYIIQRLLKETKKHDTFLYEKLYKKLLQDLVTFENSLFGKNVAKLVKDQLMEDNYKANGDGTQKWQRKDRQRGIVFAENRHNRERCC